MKKVIVFLTMVVVLCGCATNGLLRKEGNEVKSVNQEEVLRVIKEFEAVPHKLNPYSQSSVRMNEMNEKVCYMKLSPVYEWYINRLSREVKVIDDPESLELAYKEWEASKDLQVIYELTKYNSPYANELNMLISGVKESCSGLLRERNNITRLRAAYIGSWVL